MPSITDADSLLLQAGEDYRVYARPHFRREGQNLYFFLSTRVHHQLNPTEAEIWDRLGQGPALVSELGQGEAIQAMADAGVVEIVAPLAKGARRTILVVEPHSDDAALSIGATMWKMRGEAEFHLLTMASRSNYTTAFHMHRDYFERSRISRMRAAEGTLFMSHLGGHYSCADLPEATLRYRDSDWDLDFFNAHEVATAISNNRRAPSAVLSQWVAKLQDFLGDQPSFDEIWLPLGAGTHSDHDLARAAGLRVVSQAKTAATVRLYEDVPYGADFQEHTDRILNLLQRAGAKLTDWSQDVTAEFPVKLTLLSIFASQFKVGAIRPGIERSASRQTSARRIERLWTLETPATDLPADEIWIGAPNVRRIAAKLQAFRIGANSETRVAIFAINASGRWSEDLALLANLFPRASFRVYAGPRVCSEFQEFGDPRVELHCLDGGSASWLKAAVREVATGHRIIIAGDTMRKAKALRTLWPTGRSIIVPAMDDLAQALARA